VFAKVLAERSDNDLKRLIKGGVAMKLKNKIAIVTGGSQGIGEAICYAYAKVGATVIVVNSSNFDAAQQVVANIKKNSGKAESILCDVSIPAQVENLISEVLSKYGQIDILVNNAGVMINKFCEEYSVDDWDKTMNINLKGSFLMAQQVLPGMKKRKSGKIIFITSIGSTHGFPMSSAYCASKGGMLMLAKSLAAEVAPFGINVNSLSPGNTKTYMNKHLRENPEFVQMLADRTPTGRPYLSVGDIAGAAVFLASDEAKAIYGADLIVDDGWCIV